MRKGLCILLILFSIVGCKADKKNEGKVLNQLSGVLTHLDPQKRTGLDSAIQLAKVYETLVEVHPYNRPFELLPNLAAKLPHVSSDGKVYTLSLIHI